MKPRILSLAATAAFVAVTHAQAQQAAAPAQANPVAQAAAAAQASPTGPLVPGLCVLDSDRVLLGSTVGQYATRRLEEIGQQVNTELNTARNTAQTQIRSLESQRATLGEQAFATQANQVVGGLDQLVNIRAAEVRETQNRVNAYIMDQASPLIIDSYKGKNCSVVLNSGATVLRADAMDITDDVIARLNQKVTQFPIEKVQAQAQGAAPAAGGAPPVAQTPPAAGARPAQGPTR